MPIDSSTLLRTADAAASTVSVAPVGTAGLVGTTGLVGTAAAVVALGCCQADIDALDDTAVQVGMRLVRAHEQELQRYKLWLAAAITRRSDHTLGYAGLARKSGFPTPAGLIQSLTGSSMDGATKLARMGTVLVEADAAPSVGSDGAGGSKWSVLATAATIGGLNLDCADAIRRGLGKPDSSVSADQLALEAEKLITSATASSALGVTSPETLLKLARQARERLDCDAIERGQKERTALRAVRIWERDDMYGGTWRIPGEDGGAEINTALKLLLASSTGGPRFPHTDDTGNQVEKTPAQLAADAAVQDDRSLDQILADGFTQIFLNGLRADPTVVPGVSRAAVRVIVTEHVLTNAVAAEQAGAPKTGYALLEDNLTPITLSKLGEYLCEGGTIAIIFREDGEINDATPADPDAPLTQMVKTSALGPSDASSIDVGRDQRLYTRRQRAAMGVRDGGCRFPGCNKPPSWCEAH